MTLFLALLLSVIMLGSLGTAVYIMFLKPVEKLDPKKDTRIIYIMCILGFVSSLLTFCLMRG